MVVVGTRRLTAKGNDDEEEEEITGGFLHAVFPNFQQLMQLS
jgi:hypothetical protein